MSNYRKAEDYVKKPELKVGKCDGCVFEKGCIPSEIPVGSGCSQEKIIWVFKDIEVQKNLDILQAELQRKEEVYSPMINRSKEKISTLQNEIWSLRKQIVDYKLEHKLTK